MFEADKDKDDPAFAGQIVEGGWKRNTTPVDRMSNAVQPYGNEPIKAHELDTDRNIRLWDNLLGHWRRELSRQYDNRLEMGLDADFYDGIQWNANDAETVRERGQQPLVFNVIATTINWLLGTEKRGRTDYKILPRRKEGGKSAEMKTQLLKYLSDANRTEFHISRAFADAVKVGVGWLEEGVQSDDEGEPIYDRYESWRNMLHDSAATELDLEDGRYIFRSKWMDTDIAKAMFPKRKAIIDIAASETGAFFRAMSGSGDEAMDSAEQDMQESYLNGVGGTDHSDRERVRMIECWFKIPTEEDFIKGGDFTGEIFDARSPGHMSEIESGRGEVVRKVRMRTFCAIFTEAGLVHLSKSPYRHNRYPFTPIWCYRRDRDNLPYGVVRQMRDPQQDVNKRASKALHILNTNKVIMDEGAVDDLEAFKEEVSRPDAIIIKKQGKSLELNVEREFAQTHMQMMEISINRIQHMSGVTDESMGRTTNATSGRAIIARQDQGALATASIFDNLRFARQVSGEKKLSLIEQFMDKRKEFRITNQRGHAEYPVANDGMPENDIVRTKADFVISEEDWNSTMRQAQVQALMDLFTTLGPVAPEIMIGSLDLLVETMDVPQREELVKRIRALTGAEDPDADPENPDEETMQRQAAKEAESQRMQKMAELEMAGMEATVAEKMAKTGKLEVEIARILSQTKGGNVETQVRALEAAAQILSNMGLAPVADILMAEAEPKPPQPPMPPPPPPMPQQGQMPPEIAMAERGML
jgi:hypothetical protein